MSKPELRVLFRCSGGSSTGLGHVRRCLSLAQALVDAGAACAFLVDGDTRLCDLVALHGFPAAICRDGDAQDAQNTLAAIRHLQADAAVLDSYDLAGAFYAAVRLAGAMVAVIEDGATREVPADLVVNSSLEAGLDGAGRRLSKSGAKRLTGFRYALLRPDFATASSRTHRRTVRHLLLTLGGSDPQKLTTSLVEVALAALPDVEVDVVVGPLFEPSFGAGAWLPPGAKSRVSLHVDPPSIRSLMLGADIAVTAGGQTTLELAATGTPALAIRSAGNQTANLTGLQRRGVLRWVGDVCDADLSGAVGDGLRALAASYDERIRMSENGRRTVDGRGARRVAAAIVQHVNGRRG